MMDEFHVAAWIWLDVLPWKFSTDIHEPQNMNPNDFGDPLITITLGVLWL